MNRNCEFCDLELTRRRFETLRAFLKRRFCNGSCASRKVQEKNQGKLSTRQQEVYDLLKTMPPMDCAKQLNISRSRVSQIQTMLAVKGFKV